MKYELYATKDELVGFTGAVVKFQSDGEAQRAFALMVNDENTQLYHYFRDFSIWHVGTQDSITGHINEIEPRLICRGESVKRFPKEDITANPEKGEE